MDAFRVEVDGRSAAGGPPEHRLLPPDRLSQPIREKSDQVRPPGGADDLFHRTLAGRDKRPDSGQTNGFLGITRRDGICAGRSRFLDHFQALGFDIDLGAEDIHGDFRGDLKPVVLGHLFHHFF